MSAYRDYVEENIVHLIDNQMEQEKEKKTKNKIIVRDKLLNHIIALLDIDVCHSCNLLDWSNDLNWYEDMNKKDQTYWSQHKDGDCLCDDCWKDQ